MSLIQARVLVVIFAAITSSVSSIFLLVGRARQNWEWPVLPMVAHWIFTGAYIIIPFFCLSWITISYLGYRKKWQGEMCVFEVGTIVILNAAFLAISTLAMILSILFYMDQ